MDYSQFDDILSMDDPQFADRLMEALGVRAGDTVEIITPQFEREDGVRPFLPDSWSILHKLSKETLEAIGLRAWDEPDESGQVLMLFPWEWYDYIPNGLLVTDINEETEPFKNGETDDDKRCGVLAYGVKITVIEEQ